MGRGGRSKQNGKQGRGGERERQKWGEKKEDGRKFPVFPRALFSLSLLPFLTYSPSRLTPGKKGGRVGERGKANRSDDKKQKKGKAGKVKTDNGRNNWGPANFPLSLFFDFRTSPRCLHPISFAARRGEGEGRSKKRRSHAEGATRHIRFFPPLRILFLIIMTVMGTAHFPSIRILLPSPPAANKTDGRQKVSKNSL